MTKQVIDDSRFIELLTIVGDDTLSRYMKAAKIHAMFVPVDEIETKVEAPKVRKTRGPNKPKPTPPAQRDAFSEGQ